MTETEIITKLNGIFRTVFRDEAISAKPEMTANDVDNWDSLSHVDMIVMVEEEFGIRIPTWQVAKLANVGELVTVIQSRIP
jgi:acyl carrier protein